MADRWFDIYCISKISLTVRTYVSRFFFQAASPGQVKSSLHKDAFGQDFVWLHFLPFYISLDHFCYRQDEVRLWLSKLGGHNVVYDRNLVSVSATETMIKFRYRFRRQNFFCLNLNFPPFLFLDIISPKMLCCLV